MNTKKWKLILTDKELISNIKHEISAAFMTQGEFARILEVGQTHMSYILSGSRPKALEKLASYFGYERRFVRVRDKV
jgi:predicted XRE-type DNA-binding protein